MTGRRLTEAHFQTQVVQLATLYGWRGYHTHDSRRSQPGFPDLVLVRGPELIFAELKTDTGRVRPEQAEWLAALRQVRDAVEDAVLDRVLRTEVPSVDVYLWRPADFDELHGRLARHRHRLSAEYEAAA